MNIFMLISFGLIGGVIRVLAGLFKHKVFTGKEKFNSRKFWMTLALSGIIGVFCALLTLDDYRIILLAGYAGTDLIQGLAKVSR
jgi:hypothetical protein